MITESEARSIAADWHSGQGSALYAFSSSGHVDTLTELELERVVSECEQRIATGHMTGPDFESPTELLEQARAALEYVKANTPQAQAYKLGAEAAEAAASWIVDGNTKREFIPAVLELIEAGDPRADEYLPAMPSLSGEWADSPTPQSLAADILGADWDTHGYNAPDFLAEELVDELADAWEQGVADTFESACEAELRRHLA